MKQLFLLLGVLVFANPAWCMPAQILLIRHGEKPESGSDLSPRGWERAKALPALFDRQPYAAFGAPAALFGMGAKEEQIHKSDGTSEEGESSVRAIHTLNYVAARFGLRIEDRYLKGDEEELADRLRNDPALDGKFVVVCWEHKKLTDLAEALGLEPAPRYPGSHFDRAWLLTMANGAEPRFQDLAENLLPGDDPN